MLQGYPTKKGTGIMIYGDYGDLANLYETVHKVAGRLNDHDVKLKGQFWILMNFAYEVRHAYQGDRDISDYYYDQDNKVSYFGFQYAWPDIIFVLAVLRKNAGYVTTNEIDQAFLYLLEYVVKKALDEYDAQGAAMVKEYIGKWLHAEHELVYKINQAITVDFLLETPGIKRFRGIGKLLHGYSFLNGPKYLLAKSALEVDAKRYNCHPTDLEYESFPEIVW